MTAHDNHVDKCIPAHDIGPDAPATAQKLLADAAVGQWLKGSDPDLTKKLQAEQVLPSTGIFDPDKVRLHLKGDQQADNAGGAALDQLHQHNAATKQGIESGAAADKLIQIDFSTVNGTLHEMVKKTHNGVDPNADKSTVTKGDLQALVKIGSPEAKASAQRLLDNWDKNGDFTSASADRNTPAAFRNATDPFMNAVTLARGMHKHEQARATQETELQKSQAKEQQMQQAQKTLEQTIKDEQQSLGASSKFFAAVKIHKDEGYYHAASRLVGMDGKQHSEAERKLMTKLLQEQVAAAHGGCIPQILTTKDLQLKPDNVDKLFSRITEIAGKTGQN